MTIHARTITAAAAIALAASLAPAALAGTSLPATLQADIAKTHGDVQTLHDAIAADAAKIQSDVTALQGTTDRRQIAATLHADWKKLDADRRQEDTTILADWKQLNADVKAARAAHVGAGQIARAVTQMTEANLQLRADNAKAELAARQASAALRQSK